MCAACVEIWTTEKTLEERLQILGRYMAAKHSKEMDLHLNGVLDTLLAKDDKGDDDAEMAQEWERRRREE